MASGKKDEFKTSVGRILRTNYVPFRERHNKKSERATEKEGDFLDWSVGRSVGYRNGRKNPWLKLTINICHGI